MGPTVDQLVDDYLGRLDAELSRVPAARRRELVAEIANHITEARADLERADEAGVRTILDRLGDPVDIAAEAHARFDVRAARPAWLEGATLALVSVGAVIVPVVGWMVGVTLLWTSGVWSTRERLIGTLVPPGGIGAAVVWGALFFAGGPSRSGPGGLGPEAGGSGPSEPALIAGGLLLVALAVAPLVTAIYLARRLRAPAPEAISVGTYAPVR